MLARPCVPAREARIPPEVKILRALESAIRSSVARSVAACLLVAFAATLGLAADAHARMYRWIDETGKLNIGTSPPTTDYQWVDSQGRYYNRATATGKQLTYIGTATEKRVETRSSLKRAKGFGSGKSQPWETSTLRSAEPVQVGLGDQFLPTDASDQVVFGVVGTVAKASDCLAVDFENRGEATLTDLHAELTFYTSNVYSGSRTVSLAELPKGTKSASSCEGSGHVSFADGIALDHVTWKAGDDQKAWPSAKP
jgi:hypothetical protein